MKKNIIAGLLCLAVFFAAYVGGIIEAVPQAISYITGTATKTVRPSGDEGGNQIPFVRFCGDEGGPALPFNKTG